MTRNEIEGVRALFDKIPFSQVDESFVVDYKSSDGTAEFFKERGIRVIHQEKRGRGEAFRLAIEIASGQAICFFSPDGNENPDDIPKLLDLITAGYDLGIASRFLPGAKNEESDKFLHLRLWANRAFTFTANIFFNGNMSDSINGFRAVNKLSFQKLKVDAEGFAIEYQMSIRAMKLKQKIKEVPTIENTRIGGQSTASSLPTGLIFLRLLWRELWLGKNF